MAVYPRRLATGDKMSRVQNNIRQIARETPQTRSVRGSAGAPVSGEDVYLGENTDTAKAVYDQMISGIRARCDSNGSVCLGEVNVGKMAVLYKFHPTVRARTYLLGLLEKINSILDNKDGSPHFDRLRSTASACRREVVDALKVAPSDGRRLDSGNIDSVR